MTNTGNYDHLPLVVDAALYEPWYRSPRVETVSKWVTVAALSAAVVIALFLLYVAVA